MDFIRTFGLWIGMGIALVALLLVQFLYVGGIETQAATENAEVKSACERALRFSREVKSNTYPTQGDLKNATEHLEKIRQLRTTVQAKWYGYTDGLNQFMYRDTDPSKPAGGEVLDPGTIRVDVNTQKVVDPGKPLAWDVYDAAIRMLYKNVFANMQKTLQPRMAEAFGKMAMDERMAASETLLPEETEAPARQDAEEMARVACRILRAPDELILVPVDTRFGAENRHEGWREWRKYLLTRDILERAIAGTEVEMTRTLNAKANVEDLEGRKARAQTREEERAKLPKIDTVEWKRPCWRFVEQLVSLKIEGPVSGNAELPAAAWDEARQKEAAEKAKANKDYVDPLEPQAPPKDAEAVYHDIFTVTLQLKAHPKVLLAFHRKLMESESIWYAPLSLQIARLPDSTVMDDYSAALQTRSAGSGELTARLPDVAPLRSIVGFEHEPYVDATLVYEVYRFRYSDSDNYRMESTATTTQPSYGGGPQFGP